MVKTISFKNNRGHVLRGLLHIPKNFSLKHSAVIFCHGFPSSHIGRTARRIGPALERAGFMVLRVSFSGTPPSDGRFEEKLMSQEVMDIRSMVDYLSLNFQFAKLILIGHSTGAIDLSLYAHTDKRISKVILTGAVADLNNAVRYDFTDSQVRDFWRKGFIIYNRPKRFVHRKKLNRSFYDEFFSLDIPKSIRRLKRPLLVIHGEKDLIPWDREGWMLYKQANKPKRFVLIRGADHSFSKSEYWRQAVNAMISFIKK